MLSAENLAVVKIATLMCNSSVLKREILCAPDSEYGRRTEGSSNYHKREWNNVVEEKAVLMLRTLDIPDKFHGKVMGVVLLIGMNMIIWAVYHEEYTGFIREKTIDFLNISFFSQRGIIDSTKAAKELMKDESLGIKQRYKLACFYCFTNHIFTLHKQMDDWDKTECQDAMKRFKQPDLVRFWTYYVMEEVDELRGAKDFESYRLEHAIKSGSKDAVQYYLEEMNLGKENDEILVYAAMEAIRHVTINKDERFIFDATESSLLNDSCVESWMRSFYCLEIVCFLLSKMTEVQKVKFLKKDIEDDKWYWYEDKRYSRILQCFLNWPFQDHFMKTAGLMWEFLPERDYAALLIEICQKIESELGEFRYGEDRTYDYRSILTEFWCQSPECFKKYVLSNGEVAHKSELEKGTRASIGLLDSLLALKKFTLADSKFFHVILETASEEEKTNIFCSEYWMKKYLSFLLKERWEIIDRYDQHCFLSDEAVNRFQRDFIFRGYAAHACFRFVKDDNWSAADRFFKWLNLSEEQKKILLREAIYTDFGKEKCRELFLKGGVKMAGTFCAKFLSSEKEISNFYQELIFPDLLLDDVGDLVLQHKLEFLDEFINYCLPSEEEIVEFKKYMTYVAGYFFIKRLISDYCEHRSYHQPYSHIGFEIHFRGGEWEKIEEFLTWSFPTEEEKRDFKRLLFEYEGENIHFNFVKSGQWKEAETFFSWLGLSPVEVKDLKRKTLFKEDTISMFKELLRAKEGVVFIVHGSREEAIEQFFKWFLTDRTIALKFKDEMKNTLLRMNRDGETNLEYFNLMLELHLLDLENEGTRK